MAVYGESKQPEQGMMVAQTELAAGAMGLGSVVAQAVTHIAPAMGFLTGATFIATYAGTGVPLAYIGAFLVCMSIGLTLVQLAKHLPSAGGYFTYVSRTLHPRLGFMTAWLYFLYDPTVLAINLAIVGVIFEQTLKTYASITFPWWATVLVGTAAVIAVIYRGVRISGKLLIVLASIEIAMLLIFALMGLLNPGPGGVSTIPFQIDPAYGLDKTFVGVVFAIFAFTGFEAVAPMAEETREPAPEPPRAIVISLVLMGIFYVLATFGLVIGWGTDTFDETFAGQSVNAFMELAVRLFGSWGWIVLFLAILNSVIAVGISGSNAATRVWFSMARGGALPKPLAKVHPVYKTPTNAIILYAVVTLVLAFGGAWLFGTRHHHDRIGLRPGRALLLVRARDHPRADRRVRPGQHRRHQVLLDRAARRVQLALAPHHPGDLDRRNPRRRLLLAPGPGGALPVRTGLRRALGHRRCRDPGGRPGARGRGLAAEGGRGRL